MVDIQTMKIVALSVTDESVANVVEFHSLLGQSVGVVGARGGAADAPGWRRGSVVASISCSPYPIVRWLWRGAG